MPDQIQQRKQKSPDNIDETPIKAGDIRASMHSLTMAGKIEIGSIISRNRCRVIRAHMGFLIHEHSV
jgi:hypothetical protein